MVSVEEMGSKIHSIYSFHSPSSASSTHIWRDKGRSKRTIRSSLLSSPGRSRSTHHAVDTTSISIGTSSCSFASARPDLSMTENLTDSYVDVHLGELASSRTVRPSFMDDGFLALSHSHSSSEYSVCSSDISGELQRLATLTAEAQAEGGDLISSPPKNNPTSTTSNPNPNIDTVQTFNSDNDLRPEPCLGFLLSESFCKEEILETISPEDLHPTVKICIGGLRSPSIAVKRAAAAKLRFLAKNRSDNRVLIVEAGAAPALIPLLRCSDPAVQEHAVTALLNLSLHPDNKAVVAAAQGAVKSLVYVLKTGTETAKQNAAAALMSLAMVDENKLTIGACGAVPPLVALLVSGSARGKKDALTTLYKLCSARQNKERAVRAGVVKPLVRLVAEEVVDDGGGGGGGGGGGMVAEKAMVVLSSLAAIKEGKEAVVEEGGIGALVEAVEDSSDKGKEFAVMTLLQLCVDNMKNRGLLVREGGIPPLVALSQSGTAKAKHKAESLLGYLRESRRDGASSNP